MHKTNTLPEAKKEPKSINPSIFSVLAGAGTSIHFEVGEVIAGEQCVLAQISGLTDDMRETCNDNREWTTWENTLYTLTGDAGAEIQKTKGGKTGRLDVINIALFDIQNSEQLLTLLTQYNFLEAERHNQEGLEVPNGIYTSEDIRFLPENLLIATKDIRSQSSTEYARASEARDIARVAMAVSAHGSNFTN